MKGRVRWVVAIGALAVFLIVCVAVPNLMESTDHNFGAPAAASLKEGFLQAEVQFQQGGYVNPDQDGVGEFGFISEMSGRVAVGNHATLQLLSPLYQHAEDPVSYYHHAVFLPDGPAKALGEPFPHARAGDPGAAKLRRTYWIAYAWPDDIRFGQRIFAINRTGTVYSIKPAVATESVQPPAWNDLMGGGTKGWADPPVWTVLKMGERIPP